MGPGILIRYSKQVLGGAVVLLIVLGAIFGYYKLKGPVAEETPYETVNQLADCALTAAEESYPADTKEIRLLCRNDAEEDLLLPEDTAYAMEFQTEDGWHTLRSETKAPQYLSEGTTVQSGEEQELTCALASDYPSPLESGKYRIVLPGCQSGSAESSLAVEFMVE